MPLQSLDPTVVKPYIAAAWQKHLNTTEDPANGQWYTTGSSNDNIGLYGGLSDTPPNELTFDQSSLTSTPSQIAPPAPM
jgi:hypothetical protein